MLNIPCTVLSSIHQDFCCLSVCNGCRRDHNEIAGRVQKSASFLSFHRILMGTLYNFLEIVKPAARRDTHRCRLREGCQVTSKSKSLFSVLDQNETRFTLTCHILQTSTHSSRNSLERTTRMTAQQTTFERISNAHEHVNQEQGRHPREKTIIIHDIIVGISLRVLIGTKAEKYMVLFVRGAYWRGLIIDHDC